MQHRIFVVPTASRVGSATARQHWEERHAGVFTRTPGLRGYRQNRPLDEEWERGNTRVCSETWYDDRNAERAAYESDHYLTVVTPDEADFLDRYAAWSAVVLDDDLSRGDGLRILWFDEHPPPGPAWRHVRLDRPVPTPGLGSILHVADVEELEPALTLTRQASAVAFVCRAVQCDPVSDVQESAR